MSRNTKKGGKKGRKIGRAARKPKTARYKATNRRYHNKLKRVLQSCGEAFAETWKSSQYRRRQ